MVLVSDFFKCSDLYSPVHAIECCNKFVLQSFLDFGDDLEIPKPKDVFLKKDQKLENFYEIQEKLGE